MKFIAFVLLVTLLFLIPVCSATSFGIPTFEGTDGISYARSGYPNSSIGCNETLGYCENYKPAPLSARFYYDGRIYLGKDTNHYIGIQPVGIFYVNYEDPTEKEQLIGLSSVELSVNDNVATYSKGPVNIVFTNSYNRIKGDIIFPNTLPVPTVDNPALCIVWEIVGHAGINTDDGERNDWWFEQAKAYLPLGDIQNNGSKELKKKIFRQNGNVYLVEGVGYSWASSEDRTDSQFIIDPTVVYNGDDSWAGTSGTLLEHGDGNLRSPPNVTTGLVSYWNPSTDLGTGSILYDIWGVNNGAIDGAVWNTTSGMLEYDGINDYIACGNDQSFNLTNLTIITSAQTIDDNDYKTLISKHYTEWETRITSTDAHTFYKSNGAGSYEVYTIDIGWTNDVLYNLASTFSSSSKEWKTYLDGELKNTTTCGSDSLYNPSFNNVEIGRRSGDAHYFNGSMGTTYVYGIELNNDQINETRDNYHATSAYRETDTAQDAGPGQVWKYVGILGTDAGANTTGLLQINGSSDNVSFSGWQDVGSFDMDDNIVIPAGLEYRYASFRWYSNTTYQPETDIIENFVMVSPSGVFSSVWNTSLTSSGSSPSTNVKLPLEASGTYSFLVDWGDNSSDIIGTWDQDEVNHTYASEGEYTINITGQIEGWRFHNNGDKKKLINITSWGTLKLGDSDGYFYGCSNLVITATDVLDLSETTTLMDAFASCTSLTTIPSANEWNTSTINDMCQTFYNAQNFIQNISNWNTENVLYMDGMFGDNYLFNQPLPWDTGKVTTMYGMFLYAYSFNQSLPWNTTNVEDMSYMFDGAGDSMAFDQDVSNWNIENVLYMGYMFRDCTLSVENYNSLLVGWASQTPNNNVNFHGGDSQYTEGIPQSARNDTLIGTYGWIITDGGMIPETIPPTYSSADHNSTAAGRPVQFSLACNDNVALETAGQYIFSTNNTGEWINSSAVNFTSTPGIATNDTTLNSTIGITIGYRWYFSDNRNNTNSTPIYTLLTTEPINNRMPLSLFIMWSVIMFAGSVFSFITTGPKAIILSLVSATIAYVNSKLIISGDVVQYFAGVSSTDSIVTGYRTIESAALSYVFLFIALVIAIVFIAHVINELNYQLSPDLEVWDDE